MVTTLAAGCSHAKPIANLKYAEINKVPRAYEIKFSSDLNLDTLFNPDADEKVVARRLICALEDDHDFSVKHTIKRFFRGEFIALPAAPASQAGQFHYLAKSDFYETLDDDASRDHISDETLRKLLSGKKTIPCKVVMTVYMKEPYYSATMLVPVSDILKQIPANQP